MPLKIRHKLFLAILIANLLLAASIYILGNWIFSRSFQDYLNQTEANRLAPLVSALSEQFSNERNWSWITDHQDRTWQRLIRQYLDNERLQPGVHRPPEFGQDGPLAPPNDPLSQRPPPPGEPFGRPPPGGGPLAIRPYILIRDASQQLVIGRKKDASKAYWVPIKLDSNIVGELGFVRRLEISSELDQLFVNRLKNNLTWMILGILLISALISIPLAKLLVRPVERLRRAVHELASGNYQISLTQPGKDEIGMLAQDFNTLAVTLNKNLKARQQWIADISHELRTPVAILQGEIEAMIDGIRNVEPGATNSLHQEILRLSRLIDDLHELSLSDLGALSYERQDVDIVEVIRSILDQQQLVFEAQQISCSMASSEPVIQVSADPKRLDQLFSNLVNNTRYYTQSPGKLDINISLHHHRVRISWADSSPGVNDDELSRLFERLYRVDASRNRNDGGSGLGLAICQNIAEASQGEIKAQHSPTGGISIILTLPQAIK